MSIVTAQKGTVQRRQPTSGLARLQRINIVDVLALGALAVTAWFVAGFLLRDDLFIFGDHPGHYWATWYTLNVAWPEHQRIIDWDPYWYAGYPEQQFYPPGSVIVPWLFNLITLGRLTTALIYEIVVFIAYALPAFTFYYALRHLGFGRRAALAAGLFGLGFPAFFDGAESVVIGMVGSRLAFGLGPLVLVWTIEFITAPRRRYAWLAVLTLAQVILFHPYHSIGILLAVGLYVLVRRLPLVQAGARLFMIVLLAVAFDAFWLAPLVARASSAMVPYIRATFDQTLRLLTDALLLPYALLALVAVARVRREQDAVRRAMRAVLIALPLILFVATLAAHLILIERLHFYQLDPVRLIGEFYLAMVLLAAIGLSDLSGWIAQKFVRPDEQGTGSVHRRALLANVVTIIVGVALLIPFAQTAVRFQTQADVEPRFLSDARRDYRLDELWEALGETRGRVLFTSFYTRLNARGGEPLPTTLTALTPLFAKREIMGGTFGRWSPIAARMWTGKLDPPALWGLPEDQDDRALFGIPLDELSDEQLFLDCQRYNITTVVASVNDYQTRTFLDASPHFQSYYNNGYFFVYRVEGYENAWIDASNASVELLAFNDDEITLRVRAAGSNASVGVKVFAYPLWRAFTEAGKELVITRDDWGLMRIPLPRGENYSVMLRYEDGIPERLGTLISIAAAALFLSSGAVWVAKRLLHRGNLPEPVL